MKISHSYSRRSFRVLKTPNDQKQVLGLALNQHGPGWRTEMEGRILSFPVRYYSLLAGGGDFGVLKEYEYIKQFM
jgi:hypothetical protein